MSEFSPFVEAALRSAGWSEDYRFNATRFVQRLTSAGFEVSPAALDFLTRFGNLVVTCKHHNVQGATDEAEFIIKGRLEPALRAVALLKEELGVSTACFIGSCRTRYISLFLDSEGKMYGIDDESVYFIGADPDQALENIILGKELEIVLD